MSVSAINLADSAGQMRSYQCLDRPADANSDWRITAKDRDGNEAIFTKIQTATGEYKYVLFNGGEEVKPKERDTTVTGQIDRALTTQNTNEKDLDVSWGDWFKHFGKGMLSPFKAIIEHPVVSAIAIGVGIAAVSLIPGAGPVLAVAGAAWAAGHLGYSVHKYNTAQTRSEKLTALEDAGADTTALLMSAAGYKGMKGNTAKVAGAVDKLDDAVSAVDKAGKVITAADTADDALNITIKAADMTDEALSVVDKAGKVITAADTVDDVVVAANKVNQIGATTAQSSNRVNYGLKAGWDRAKGAFQGGSDKIWGNGGCRQYTQTVRNLKGARAESGWDRFVQGGKNIFGGSVEVSAQNLSQTKTVFLDLIKNGKYTEAIGKLRQMRAIAEGLDQTDEVVAMLDDIANYEQMLKPLTFRGNLVPRVYRTGQLVSPLTSGVERANDNDTVDRFKNPDIVHTIV